jgi:hypothetical protein
MFKTAIEGTVARSKFINKVHYTEVPAYCACVLTSNSQPPTDPGYRRRAISICFTQADVPTDEEQEVFKKLMRERVSQELCILGDFVANYMLDNQKELLLSDKGIDWKAISTTIISNIYKAAGRDPPEWINYVEETQLSDSREDVELVLRAFFLNKVNETYNKHYRSISNIDHQHAEVPNMPFSHRLNFCLDHNLIPFLNKTKNALEIIITSDIMHELKQFKIDYSISSLAEISRIISGFEYGQKKLGGRNVRAAYGPKVKLLDYLDAE